MMDALGWAGVEGMKAARPCAAALVALAVAVPPASAEYRISGHGFGHGVGLAQYGAMGYARETTHT